MNLRHHSPEFVLKRIVNHKNVERLVLEHDKLTYLPRTVADLKRLRSVSLSDNRIADIANVSFLNELPRLQKLTLSKNPLKSLKGLRVYSLQTLEAQRCGKCNLRKKIIPNISIIIIIVVVNNDIIIIIIININIHCWLQQSRKLTISCRTHCQLW